MLPFGGHNSRTKATDYNVFRTVKDHFDEPNMVGMLDPKRGTPITYSDLLLKVLTYGLVPQLHVPRGLPEHFQKAIQASGRQGEIYLSAFAAEVSYGGGGMVVPTGNTPFFPHLGLGQFRYHQNQGNSRNRTQNHPQKTRKSVEGGEGVRFEAEEEDEHQGIDADLLRLASIETSMDSAHPASHQIVFSTPQMRERRHVDPDRVPPRAHSVLQLHHSHVQEKATRSKSTEPVLLHAQGHGQQRRRPDMAKAGALGYAHPQQHQQRLHKPAHAWQWGAVGGEGGVFTREVFMNAAHELIRESQTFMHEAVSEVKPN